VDVAKILAITPAVDFVMRYNCTTLVGTQEVSFGSFTLDRLLDPDEAGLLFLHAARPPADRLAEHPSTVRPVTDGPLRKRC
jgi:hypothetical protein